MKSYYILLTVLALVFLFDNSLLAQSKDSSKEQIQQLEARLPGTKGRERFEILLELTELAQAERNPSSVLVYGEQAQTLLLSVGDPRSELNLVLALTRAYSDGRDLDPAHDAARRTGELARELGDTEALAWSFESIGNIHRYRAEHDQALESYAEAQRLYETLGYLEPLGGVLNNSALVHENRGDHVETLRLYLLAREAFDEAGYLPGLALTSTNIGVVYKVLGQYEDAEAAFLQALGFAIEVGSEVGQADALRWLGGLTLSRGEPQRGLDFLQQSLDIFLSLDIYLTRRINVYSQMGEAWAALGDDTQALKAYRQALSIATELENWRGVITTQSGIAQVHRRRGELDTAIELLERALEVAREKEYLYDVRTLSQDLQGVYAETGRYREAYAALQEYEALSSESLGEESRQALAKLQASFEAAEREKEIELLEKDRSLQQAKLARQHDNQRTIVAGFVFFLILLALLFNWYRLRTQAAAMALAVEQEKAVSKGLREVDKLKDEFLANTSHELRTPLYGMIGLVEALLNKSSNINPEDRNILNVVLQSGRRLSKLVADILDFSKLRHQSLELALEPVELHSLVDVVLTLCKPILSGNNIKLVNAIAPDLPHVQADEARIEQILHNLVGNAIKFTEQGKIEVSARQQGDELLVQVSDTGIGIAPEQQEKIFDFFVQADSSTQREYGGTGLGLAVSRQLVELHNGHIKVESVPGEGSTFSFTLPIAKAGAKDEGSDELIEEAYERRPAPEVVEQSDLLLAEDVPEEAEQDSKVDLATILIVDDEPVVHQVLKLHLASKNYRLLNAANGAQALDIIETNKVDLVLLDIMMPRMTGYEVCRTIRKTRSREKLPVVFLSAKDRSRDRVASFDEGGNDYLIKPIGRNELLIRVNTQLEILNVYRGKEEEIHLLQDILPICSWCKKIRDDEGFWNQLEWYFHKNTDVMFSHGICPDCMKKEQKKIMGAQSQKE